jgi:hypothetical protein
MPGLKSPFRESFAWPPSAVTERYHKTQSAGRFQPVLFPAGFGLPTGDRFDDGQQLQCHNRFNVR